MSAIFELFSWPDSEGAVNVPEQPLSPRPGCTWALPPSSWKMPTLTVTFWQSIGVPSSGSVTVTLYGISSPHSKKPPWTGTVRSTSGRVLPAVTTTVDVPDLPVVSVAVSRTVYVPGFWNVCVGVAPETAAVPSSKSHEYVRSSPSASSEPSLENVTCRGAGPESLSALATATGVRVPLA